MASIYHENALPKSIPLLNRVFCVNDLNLITCLQRHSVSAQYLMWLDLHTRNAFTFNWLPPIFSGVSIHLIEHQPEMWFNEVYCFWYDSNTTCFVFPQNTFTPIEHISFINRLNWFRWTGNGTNQFSQRFVSPTLFIAFKNHLIELKFDDTHIDSILVNWKKCWLTFISTCIVIFLQIWMKQKKKY